MPSGHSATGTTENQTQGIFLAKHGIAALCYDPIGQGERYQLLDDTGKPRFKATDEHTLIGASCILLGRSTATYRVSKKSFFAARISAGLGACIKT
ncbi:MAG: hypothetical protein FJ398_14655 [Verrucomicrobia bacterium]|nr:hypothetical protein [Verrucomicrobiota bacterium]